MARKPDPEKRNHIIAAAITTFAQKGYAGTRIVEVAQAAGIGKGTIYEYFRSKEDLFFATFEQLMYESEAQVLAPLSEVKNSTAERLKAIADALLRAWLPKLDLYGLKFYYTHVLHKSWVNVNLIKPPKTQRLPDIVSVEEAQRLFMATRTLSYRVFYFTVYSLGLRLGEGLRLEVGDIDASRQRVHVRDAKGNKDRFVPLPEVTLDLLRRFWQVHRHPVLLFPNRQGGLKAAGCAAT